MKPQLSELQQQLDDVELAVQYALELAAKEGTSAAECSISKSAGISVGTRMGDVETVEFNQDGALGISVYRDHQKGRHHYDLSRGHCGGGKKSGGNCPLYIR